jgi:hypothetical protein
MVALELLEAGPTDHGDVYGSWRRMLESSLLGKLWERSILPWKWVGRSAIVTVVGKFPRALADYERY